MRGGPSPGRARRRRSSRSTDGGAAMPRHDQDVTNERWTESAAVPPPAPRNRRRWVLGVGIGVLVLLVGVVVLLVRPSAVTPAGTYVAGVAVGGLNDQQLRDALNGPVREKVEQPVEIVVGDERFTARP